jgi:serine/threonine protein kinase
MQQPKGVDYNMGACSQIETLRTLGKYPLLEKLGEGCLGPVYKSFDQELGCAVVLRILCDGIKWDSQLEEIFYRECRAISALQHQNIAGVLEAGKEEQSYFIVMESLGDSDLKSLIARKPDMPVEAKIAIMIQVAEGLSHAHKNGLLHRSLAPGKIHLTANGAKIRDFAIAGLLMKHLPRPAVRWGVPIYLSPEQIQQQSGDERSDVFSAGIIFYELLTYGHPFHDPDGNKALDNILLDLQIATFDRYPDVPPGVWAVLKKCLAKNPNDRYAGMEEFSGACRDLMKDLAEDIQLMLVELHSSLPSLRKAAAEPNASEKTVKLLQEIESLLHGRKEADYVSLDRLVTVLMEQHPTIQKAASLVQPWESKILAATEIKEPNQPAPPTPISEIPVKQKPPAPVPNNGNQAGSGNNSPNRGTVVRRRTIGEPEKKAEPPVPWSQNSVASPKTRRHRVRSGWRYGSIPMPTYRNVAALLSILLIVTATYIVIGTGVGKSVGNAWNSFAANFNNTANASVPQAGFRQANASSSTASRKTPAVNKNINEGNSQSEAAPLPIKESKNEVDPARGSLSSQPKQRLARISDLIDSGNLPMAKMELDQLQKAHPGMRGVSALRKKYEAQEQARREQEQKTTRKQRENEWVRQTSDLFMSGKYNEVSNTLNLWLAEDPGSLRAQEFTAKNEEIQRALKAYSSAITENRYQDALSAIGRAEKVNPADSTFSELRQHVESRRAVAKAFLSVHRLGEKATILLDGKPIGKDGETSNESVSIGSHTLAIENEGNQILSKVQDFNEGEQLAFVYDLAKQNLRPIVESDRELLVRRKLTEEVYHFELDHEHGLLRGNCRGTLLLNSLDLAYKPFSGSHAFRISLKALNLRINGRSAEFTFTSDGSRFQSFKFSDVKAAEKFMQKWDELKSRSPQ